MQLHASLKAMYSHSPLVAEWHQIVILGVSSPSNYFELQEADHANPVQNHETFLYDDGQ